ncbi:MAG: hypothetical protein V1914_01845 [archaeon]
MKKLIRNLVLPSLVIGSLVGIIACKSQEPIVGDKISITYGKNFVSVDLPSGSYKHFERIGFDGTRYCMQILKSNDAEIFMDGSDGRCDENIDLTAIFKKPWAGELLDCEGEYCIAANTYFKLFKKNNSIEEIREQWDEIRNDCDTICNTELK